MGGRAYEGTDVSGMLGDVAITEVNIVQGDATL